MRYALLALALVACIAVWQGFFVPAYDHATTAALSDEARRAIDLNCDRLRDRSERECRAILKRLYLSGALHPDTTLRTYCDSLKRARWAGSRPKPPKVCTERFGGGQSG